MAKDYPKFLFGFSVVTLSLPVIVYGLTPGGIPATGPIQAVGPYAAGYIAELVIGLTLIFLAMILQIAVSNNNSWPFSYIESSDNVIVFTDVLYYLAPLGTVLIFYLTALFLGIQIGFVGLPVGGTYTGGEGFAGLLVLIFGNDIAHYIFNRATQNRFD